MAAEMKGVLYLKHGVKNKEVKVVICPVMLHTPSWNAELSFSVKPVCCPVSSRGN